jgi:hypothetical protein
MRRPSIAAANSPPGTRFVIVGAVAIGIAAVVAVVLANDVGDVQAVDQNFALGFDQQVSNGTIDGAAAPGAGNIEAGGDRDIYSFTVPANTEIFIETFSVTSSGTLRWTLAPTSGPPVFANTFISNDPGRLLLTAGGAYTLTAFGDGAATGTYSFVIHSVPNPEFFRWRSIRPSQTARSAAQRLRARGISRTSAVTTSTH